MKLEDVFKKTFKRNDQDSGSCGIIPQQQKVFIAVDFGCGIDKAVATLWERTESDDTVLLFVGVDDE